MTDGTRREPTDLLPLRWGIAGERVAAGLLLIVSGAVTIAGANAFAIWVLVPGIVAHVAGWSILPSDGWRRVVAALTSTPAVLLLLTGPHFIGVLVVPYLGWLLVRHRPARSYLTVLFPAAGAVLVATAFPQYSGMLAALAIEGGVLAASAWIARMISRAGS